MQIRELQFKNLNFTNNIHQQPQLKKIVVSNGLGLQGQNKKILEKSIEEIRQITGQHPKITISKKAESGFKLKKNVPIGLKVTLRKKKMYAFIEKLIHIVFPRLRDFKGYSLKKFDRFGNYNFGIVEQLCFPEINVEDVDQIHGFNINLHIKALSSTQAQLFLKNLGFPFERE